MQKKLHGLSSRLLELRGSSTQSEFSAAIGLVQQTYAQWELGNRQPKLQELVRLAQYFGVSTDWLLGLSDVRMPFQNANVNSEMQSRLNETELELRRYKTAFAKLTKSLKCAVEVVEQLEDEAL